MTTPRALLSMRKVLTLSAVAVFTMGAAQCSHVPMDSSKLALAAGQATMVLGGCERSLTLGYDACQLTKGQGMPPLRMFFTNAAEWAVSDCELNLYKSGSVKEAGEVEIDTTALNAQIEKNGFCILKVEAVEKYPDPMDPKQTREIPIAGGWFVELLDSDYFPTPTPAEVAWCYQVQRTTKGRTTVKRCPNP